ncbi:MAG: hypothetical protein CME15_11550 [Gemmatimonadetes bacterium]|nr:hypothetical protein [Gemmatimonadota bacterium]
MAETSERQRPVLAMGEALVEFMPAPAGQTMAGADHFDKFAGGAPATYAAALVRLGVPAGLISRIGEDPFSDFLHEALAAEGVAVDQIRRLPDRQIGLCFHECLAGVTSLIFYRRDSAATTMTPDDVDVEAIRSAAALHVPGVALQISEGAKEACLTAIRIAAEASVPISFDPNMRNLLGGTDTAQAMEEALSLADLVTPTSEEAAAITGQEDPSRAAVELRARGPGLVAVTLASEGAVLASGEEVITCPGFEVAVVEPTGAGDVHAAAMMIGLLSGWELERTGRFANAAGALAVTAMGHLGEALPTPESILSMLDG